MRSSATRSLRPKPRDVVVVEHEPLAEQLVEAADQENGVRRIAGVNDVETAAEEDLQRKPELHEQRDAVFEQVAREPVRLARQRVPVDVDVIDALETFLVARSLGTDDGNRIARRRQGARLLHHPPVEGTRQVLDDHQHSTAVCGFGHCLPPRVG
jgi:hypothetical protein